MVTPCATSRLQTDLGKEFNNALFRGMLKREGIQHFSTHRDAKASVVERFNRTLKERRAYLNVLPQLLNGYNQTCHRSIGMAPRDVTDDNKRVVWTKLYGKSLKRRPRRKLKVGDRVPLSKKHRPFKKGYLPGWTEAVSLYCETRGAGTCGHLQIGRMGFHALGREFIRARCPKRHRVR